MDRRLLLRSLLGTAGSLALRARAGELPADPATSDATLAAFEAHRAGAPWTLGYEGLQADAAPMPLKLRGRMPLGLRGALYRNGAARHQLGDMRYHHWFDGDGMVQKYTVTDRGIEHRGRFLRTEKFLADSAAGRPVRIAFGTNPPGAERVGSPDSINVANTSVIRHAGEFLALWEGGSATGFDPETLATGELKTWSPDYQGMPFSAHPKVEPDGTLWNFGVSSARGLLSIYRISAKGEALQTVTLKIPQMTMLHDFVVTEKHLVFLLPPLVFDADRLHAGQTFLDSHVWKPELGMRALVLHKDRLEAPQWMELPAGFLFHCGNAWEDRNGVIRMDFIRSDDAYHATSGIKSLMQGRYEGEAVPAVALVQLDTRTGRARQTLLPHKAEFPRVGPRVVGRRYSQVFMAERIDARDRPGYDAVTRLNVVTGKSDRFRYGANVMVEEHVFVPNPAGSGKEGDGWLVGTALDLNRKAMLFSVFDAQRLSAGPLAQAEMARPMPLGLHAIFVPT